MLNDGKQGCFGRRKSEAEPPEQRWRYEDIVGISYLGSMVRPHMDPQERAAQFSPFSALTGYEEAVQETARRTEQMPELSEDQMCVLNEQIRYLRAEIGRHPEIMVTYFEPDRRKAGGRLSEKRGRLKMIKEYEAALVFEDGTAVPADFITDIRIFSGEKQGYGRIFLDRV